MLMATAALAAQETGQSGSYQGTSTPPPDDTIVTTTTPLAKPPAGKPAAAAQYQLPAPAPVQPQLAPPAPALSATDPDGGTVAVEQSAPASQEPTLIMRSYTVNPNGNPTGDPDGDIVHPRPLRPGELPEGTSIRVRLLGQLSTVSSERGEAFRSRVASDVLLGGQVLIPAGTEIDGRVAEVSSGHTGGHGSMRLQPETLILPDGSRFRLHAEITGTPGSHTKVRSEGVIVPNSRLKSDSIQYGGAVGGGAITGAILGGPVGALAGGAIGAGVITAHLLTSHPQAKLESGAALLFTLTEPLQMAPVTSSGN